MRWIVPVALACLTACGSSIDDDDEPRGCAEVMYDSLLSPYPKADGWCFPGLGEDSPVGHNGTGECNDESPSVVIIWGRFFAACSGCGPGFWYEDCRPLICTTDEDCPSFADRNGDDEIIRHDYECRNSLCQSVDTERYPLDFISAPDAELLCLANVERGEFYEGEPYCPGVGFFDDEPCPLPLPDDCMQP